jgi:hypothetical protein
MWKSYEMVFGHEGKRPAYDRAFWGNQLLQFGADGIFSPSQVIGSRL